MNEEVLLYNNENLPKTKSLEEIKKEFEENYTSKVYSPDYKERQRALEFRAKCGVVKPVQPRKKPKVSKKKRVIMQRAARFMTGECKQFKKEYNLVKSWGLIPEGKESEANG